MAEFLMTFDNGNSNPHIGFFQGKKLVKVQTLDEFSKQESWKKKPYQEASVVLSQVGRSRAILRQLHPRIVNLKSFKRKKHFFHMPYQYTETLGDDRLFQSFYLFDKFISQSPRLPRHSRQSILLIDAGTFTTVDWITHKGYEGGFIFPGLQTFLNSYHIQGSQLPLLSRHEVRRQNLYHLPHSTEQAILKAAKIYLQGIYQQVEELYLTKANKTKVSSLYLTGGEASWHRDFLPTCHSFHWDKNLIHRALAHLYFKREKL